MRTLLQKIDVISRILATLAVASLMWYCALRAVELSEYRAVTDRAFKAAQISGAIHCDGT